MPKQIQNIPYIDILKQSWHLIWTKKYLWWLGLLASFSSGMGSFSNYSSSGEDKRASEFISQNFQWVMIAAAAIFLVCAILFIIGLIGRGGLIKSISEELAKRPSNFRAGFREGKKFFWKIFGLNIIIFFILLISVTVLAVPVIFLITKEIYFLGIILAVIAMLILIPVFILISFVKIYGELYIVLGKIPTMPAIESAYNLFRKNLLASIIMGLLFIPIGLVMMIAIFAALLPIAIVAVVTGLIFYAILGRLGAIIIAVLAITIFLICILFLKSVYETFSQTAWILFFHKIAKPKVKEKVAIEEVEEEKEILPAASDAVKTFESEK